MQKIEARSQVATPPLVPIVDCGKRISFGAQSGVDMASALEGLAACLRLAVTRRARQPVAATIRVDLRGALVVDGSFDQEHS